MDHESIKNNGLNENHQVMQLLDDLAVMLITSSSACKYLGLMNGKMGIVVFLFHYAQQTGDSSFANEAEKLIDEIQDNLHAGFPFDFAGGLTGIGTGMEYLVQQGFLSVDTDELLEDFDNLFAGKVHEEKLYLSTQNLIDLKRFFSARLENLHTKKRDFLHKIINDILVLLELHKRTEVIPEDFAFQESSSDNPNSFGLDGHAGKGLALLSGLNPQHKTWLRLI